MRSEVQPEELNQMNKVQPRPHTSDAVQAAAGLRLLETYTSLAERGEHLLGRLLAGQSPRQWARYPEEDAIDQSSGYQWFYHSHSPEDRQRTNEHGHIHLFARKSLWAEKLGSRSEQAFARLCGKPAANPTTRHLLAIAFDAKGLPISLFTVNSWVTGDLMLGKDLTLELLSSMTLNTGYPEIEIVIESVVRLCAAEAQELIWQRDATLGSHPARDKLEDQKLELLSQVRIDLDPKLCALSAFL